MSMTGNCFGQRKKCVKFKVLENCTQVDYDYSGGIYVITILLSCGFLKEKWTRAGAHARIELRYKTADLLNSVTIP